MSTPVVPVVSAPASPIASKPAWPKTKTIAINNQEVSILATKIVRPDFRVTVSITATVGSVSYTEVWSIGHGSSTYTPQQAQIDYEAHCQKVAAVAASRSNANVVTEALV